MTVQGRRDGRIDSLRGLLLVVMTTDHLAPDWITAVTSETFGFVSAMEGFFLLAGYSFAVAYRGLLVVPGALWRKVRARALRIYVYHLGSLGIAFVVGLLGLLAAVGWDARAADAARFGPALFVWTLLLLYRPQYFDVLPCYVLLLLAAPVALRAMAAGGLRATAFLGLSAALWAVGRAWDPLGALARAVSPIESVWPNALTWQLPFMLGMACALGVAGLGRPWTRAPGLTAVCGVLALACCALRHGWLEAPPTLLAAFDKANLGPLRVLNLLLLLQLGGVLIAGRKPTARQAYLALLGANALEVFSFHVLLAYAVQPWFDEFEANGDALRAWALLATCLAALALPAYVHQRLVRGRG